MASVSLTRHTLSWAGAKSKIESGKLKNGAERVASFQLSTLNFQLSSLLRLARRAARRTGGFFLDGSATARTHRSDVAAHHAAASAELVVQRVAVNTERTRSLRHIPAIRVHRRSDVLSFEGVDGLLERDAVSDQFANDLIQAIVNTRHEFLKKHCGDSVSPSPMSNDLPRPRRHPNSPHSNFDQINRGPTSYSANEKAQDLTEHQERAA